jgi:hypothetical protein
MQPRAKRPHDLDACVLRDGQDPPSAQGCWSIADMDMEAVITRRQSSPG